MLLDISQKRTAQTFIYNPYSRWEGAEIWNLILYRHKCIPKPAEVANETAIMMNKIHAMQSEVRRDLDQAITSAIRPFLTDAVDIRLQKYFRYLRRFGKRAKAAGRPYRSSDGLPMLLDIENIGSLHDQLKGTTFIKDAWRSIISFGFSRSLLFEIKWGTPHPNAGWGAIFRHLTVQHAGLTLCLEYIRSNHLCTQAVQRAIKQHYCEHFRNVNLEFINSQYRHTLREEHCTRIQLNDDKNTVVVVPQLLPSSAKSIRWTSRSFADRHVVIDLTVKKRKTSRGAVDLKRPRPEQGSEGRAIVLSDSEDEEAL